MGIRGITETDIRMRSPDATIRGGKNIPGITGLSLPGLCRTIGLPEPVAEYRFHPKRRWRFDFAWPDLKIALEFEGATWTRGRHTRGTGYRGDCIKYSESAILGWCVIRVTTDMVRSGEALDLVKRALEFKRETWGGRGERPKMKLTWTYRAGREYMSAQLRPGCIAILSKESWARLRPWRLSMQGPDALVNCSHFEARFRTRRDAVAVANLMMDLDRKEHL